jgi:hypothetical protein
MRLRILVFVLALLPVCALADDADNQGMFYLAGGGGSHGPSLTVGGGTRVDALELNAIDLGTTTYGGTAKFVGLSLVQNTTPKYGFNALVRLGMGRETTSFPGGLAAHQMWFANGIYFGLGAQYRVGDHFALRAEVNRIRYAASPDGLDNRLRYPVTLSAMLIF